MDKGNKSRKRALARRQGWSSWLGYAIGLIRPKRRAKSDRHKNPRR